MRFCCFSAVDFPLTVAHSQHAPPGLELTNFIKLPVNPQCNNGRGRIIGSVNGLICFIYGCHSLLSNDYVIYIWNPSLSAMLTLPSFPLSSRRLHFRFGFDPKSDDYKVVMLTSIFQPPSMAPQVHVYSMRKGSWELISQIFPSHITWIKDHDEVCVDDHDGHLHWLRRSNLGSKPKTIVAFDLGAETFRDIPLPDSVLHQHEKCMNVLGVLFGKLCVMSWVRGVECEVWVMDEYGVAESWVKHHAFSQFSGEITLYGFTSHSELLFEVDCCRFALYDPITAKTKIFKIILGQSFYICSVVEYVDSLVWIAPASR